MAHTGFAKTKDGLNIHYRHEENGKPLLVFSHGISMDSESWTNQTLFFKDKYSTLTYDIRGHGKSDKPKDEKYYTVKGFINDLEAITEKIGAERFTLIGFSLGGSIALEYAHHHQENLEALIAINTPYQPSLIRDSFYQQLAIAMKTPKFLFGIGLDDKPIWQYQGKLTTYRKAFMATEKHVIRNIKNSLHSYRPQNSKIEIPHLIIHSTKDEIVKPEPPLNLTNVRFIEDGHHFVIAQKPDDVNNLVEEFLKEEGL